MPQVPAYAAFDPSKPLGPYSVGRRDPGPKDVAVDILFCGAHGIVSEVELAARANAASGRPAPQRAGACRWTCLSGSTAGSCATTGTTRGGAP